jgi:predicted nucleotidyltransferase
MIELIEQRRPDIETLCRHYGVKRLELFGSAAAGRFDASRSDIDFFYEFDAEEQIGLADRFFGLKKDLEKLLGATVDLVSAADATNPYFLQVANQNRTILYAA